MNEKRDTLADALRPSRVGDSLTPGGRLNRRGSLAHTLVDMTAIVSLTVLAALGKIEGYVAVCAVCLIAGVWLAQGGGKAGPQDPRHLGVLLGSLQGLWELVRRFRGIAVMPLMLLTACASGPHAAGLLQRIQSLQHVQQAVCDQAEATLADVAAVLPSGVDIDIEPATVQVLTAPAGENGPTSGGSQEPPAAELGAELEPSP